MDIDIDDIEVLQFQIDVDERGETSASMLMQTIAEKSSLINDLKQELREEKIKYNNLVDAVFEKVLHKKKKTKTKKLGKNRSLRASWEIQSDAVREDFIRKCFSYKCSCPHNW